MFEFIYSVFSFLTIFPYKKYKLEYVAQNMHLFPIVGITIGLFASLSHFLLALIFHNLIVSLFIVLFYMYITGLHHLDGLMDFSDGIMTKGNKAKKIKSMKDPFVGSAGSATMIFHILGLIFIISMLDGFVAIKAIILSEMLSKFSMVLQAASNTSIPSSSSSLFIKNIRCKNKMIFSTSITLFVSLLIAGIMGLVIISIILVLTLIISSVSKTNFGGISGDVFGATNELTRSASLFLFVII
ncbi:MAG: adenosylcobinamide-GDP ribazoletransferase [Thaumarchaeota archaeon]|nr:adenosylcobinamide-GDP ribazoletransferase [Nitrososphaerota archaeon]MCY3976089.1 adenosylcobinamide-GDP ribazoletransferase [Nitrososphaerota archaeon]